MEAFPQGPWVSRTLAAIVLILSAGLGAYATFAPPAGKRPTPAATITSCASFRGPRTIRALLDHRVGLGERNTTS